MKNRFKLLKWGLIGLVFFLAVEIILNINLFRTIGVGLIMLGGILNFIVMSNNNGKMPVLIKDKRFMEEIKGGGVNKAYFFKRSKGKIKTFLLADIITFTIPKRRGSLFVALSIGDIVTFFGAFVIIFSFF